LVRLQPGISLDNIPFPIVQNLKLEGEGAAWSRKLSRRPPKLGLHLGDLGSTRVVEDVEGDP
jgi:hypothetical protein